MEQRNRRVQYLVAISVSLASMTLGVCSAWPTPVIPKFHDNETDIKITENDISWMLAMSSPGFMAGSLATRFISDKFGRRTTILGSALPIAIGMIIVACALKAWLLYMTTFLWSCGTGIIGTVLSVYMVEICDKEIRGTLSLCTKFMFNFGNLLIMTIGPFVTYKTLNYMLLVLPACYFIACWWIPESPYYYLKEGRRDAAKRELTRLRGYKDMAVLEGDLMMMQSDVKNEMHRSSSAKELFTGKPYRKALIIVTGLKMTQIMTGALTIQQYLGRIMQESNCKMELSTMLIVFGAVRFVVGIMSSILVDRVGRRPLLFWSYLGTGVSLAIVGTYFFLQEVLRIDKESLSAYGVITFVGIVLSNIISTVGFNSLIIVIPAEIFPLNVKAVAMTSLNIFGGILSFIVAKGYQSLKDVSGLCGVFWVFAAVAFIGAVFVLLVVPETKGKSLRDIQIQLQGDAYVDGNEKLKQVIASDAINCEDNELVVLKPKESNL